jgi:hypothetical protein
MTPTRFGQSPIENVNSWQKMTDTMVFLREPAVRLCKKVCSKWSGNWYKVTSNFYIYRPTLNIGADVYLWAVPYLKRYQLAKNDRHHGLPRASSCPIM